MFKDFTILEAIRIGGPVMYFLILCSIVSVAIILERAYYFYKRTRVSRASFMQQIREHLVKGDFKGAEEICKNTLAPFSSVAKAGLSVSLLDEKDVTDAMEREIVIEINQLEKWTSIVGTIGSTAVYVGLLGTVWGIIETFRDIAQIGSGGINVVIHGIAEALVCTAAGLFVAIPAVMAYNYFVKRISVFVMEMELCASELAGLIKGQRRGYAKKL